RINDETGTADKGSLFNQEQLPSESLFYSVIAAQKNYIDCLDLLANKLKENGNILQIGGDETIGLGFCSVEFVDCEGN
ncbi:MAG: RAMP superfamily CRISPR-associated protein, partial [Victivallaceae bacterium]